MAMKELYSDNESSKTGKYKEGIYFTLSDGKRDLVNSRAEEICIATCLLLLASNKKFGASKQELHNDLVKGKDNYPRTVAGVLKYLQPHTL